MPTNPVSADFVPKQDYICRDFARAEKDRLWPRVWQVACREEELAKVGDTVVYDICDQSIVVVRSAADRIQAFYNVCMHRGRRLVDDTCHVARFHCTYHGWRWKLDGSVERILDEQDWAGCGKATREDFRLPEIRVGTWGGFVFVNLDPECEPLETFLDPMPQYIDPFRLERARFRWYYSVKVPCNWKVALEAFDEGYHVAATHPQLLEVNGDDYTYAQAKGKHGMFGYAPASLALFGGPSPRLNRAPPQDRRQGLVNYARLYNNTLHAIVTEKDAAAATRLLTECTGEEEPLALIGKLGQFQKEAALAAGAFYPEVTGEQRMAAGSDWHVFPNLVFLPSQTGTLCYRSRPWGDGTDPDWCVYDIWSLEQYAPGVEPPLVRNKIYSDDGWKAIGDVSVILEQDFVNMEQVQRGLKQAGFPGCRTSPVQEVAISNMHRVLHEYVD
jgi:phenylpropionate dioxygenase-like ring-hydroxylating dioxygenase large terminal subunit